MNSLIETFKKKQINISPMIWEHQDLANAWEIQTIIENPDVFDDFYHKYLIGDIDTIDEYYLYLLTRKFQSFSEIIPMIIKDDHKDMINALVNAADKALQEVSTKKKNLILFINNNIDKVFNAEIEKYDIRFVTLDLIAKYNTGIKKETFAYLCEHYRYLIIDRFDSFESVFEKSPELFDLLFPIGVFDEIKQYRFEKTLDIWSSILRREKSKLKGTIERNIPEFYKNIVVLAQSACVDNIIQTERFIRLFYHFLQEICSPLANEFAQYAKSAEDILSKSVLKHGQSFQFTIPLDKITKEWKSIEPWEMRLFWITHFSKEEAGQTTLQSRLDEKPENEKTLIDLASSNIPSDDYYTLSHQQKLSIAASCGTGTILGILRNQETLHDYCSLVCSANSFISQFFPNEKQALSCDMEMLVSGVQLVVNNQEADSNTLSLLCYGTSMFICAYMEKLLRLFYLYLVKTKKYVQTNKATLGELLTVNNCEITAVFGEHHIKTLSFFQMQTQEKRIGRNIRNRLAHWDNMTPDLLNVSFVAQMLWIFTDILNTIFWYFLKESPEGA